MAASRIAHEITHAAPARNNESRSVGLSPPKSGRTEVGTSVTPRSICSISACTYAARMQWCGDSIERTPRVTSSRSDSSNPATKRDVPLSDRPGRCGGAATSPHV